MITNRFFPEIKGNFGFGCMRLPMIQGDVDLKQMEQMADAFLAAGLNYIDTAHGYLGGKSETAIRDTMKSMSRIACTGCKYCILDNDCPKKINIPEIFSCYNNKLIYNNEGQKFVYMNFITREGSRASDCLKCGKCEKICPQHLPIREYLAEAAEELEH